MKLSQQMQSETSDDPHQDSENDEGFIINQLQIKNHDVPPLLPLSQQRPNDYLPRYIAAHHLLREMPEAASSFPHFPHDDQPTINCTSRRKLKQLAGKPQQENYYGKNYRIVYQRYARRQEVNDSPTRNDVSLESVVTYSAESYSLAKQWEMPTVTGDDLCFESRFESGNLMLAYRSMVDAHSYKLLLQNDTNSKGYNRWFYFAVSNAKRGISYKFQMTNFRKYLQFFRQGLRPTCFSLQQHRETGNGWSKCGRNLQFQKTEAGQEQYYTLSFQVDFDYNDDVCLFSLLPPYSYSKLSNFLLEANQTAQERTDIKFTLSTVAYSLTNTQVPEVTISGPVPAQKTILILARQHPGEVWSSFLAEAIIRELMRQPSVEKDWLLQNFTFRIFPMVNVDGVLHGNFRCDLSGMDMNRCWKNPNKLLHPHLIAIKDEIRRLSMEGGVTACLDLHSHSKDYNIFAYCCRLDLQGKLLPFLFSRATPLFNFGSCTYGISKYKQSTARAVIHEITHAQDVLTIEASFFASTNPMKVIHPAAFFSFANAVLLSLKHYYSKTKYMQEAAEAMPKAIAEIAEKAKNRKRFIDEESGSDSQPACDQIELSEKIGNILPRCPIVQACFNLKPEQKLTEEEITKLKQNASLKKPKKKKKLKRQTKQQTTLEDKVPEKELQIPRVQKPPLIALKNEKTNSFRKSLLEPMFKKRGGQYSRQGKTLQAKPNRSYLNQSLELGFPGSVSKSKPGTEFRSTLREKEFASYEFHYRYQKKEEEEFPMLCVLSDRRKEAHLERLRRIHPPPSQRQRSIPHYQPTLVVNKKLDTMQRLRERQKNSSDLVSSIWRESLGHGGDSLPIRSVFYGGS